jgi:hypothetical protein
MAYTANVKQGGLWRWVNQQVKIALFGIFAMQHGTEHTRIGGVVPCHDFADGYAV